MEVVTVNLKYHYIILGGPGKNRKRNQWPCGYEIKFMRFFEHLMGL